MKDFSESYLSGEDWLIYEKAWEPRHQQVREAQFTLGNGYIGSRGVLEEIPREAYPGTYMGGLYDKTAAQATEMVNLPNPIDFKIIAAGEKVGVANMDILRHSRVLDMKKGLLQRHSLYLNSKKERFDYQSLRFFSMNEPRLGVMQVFFTPLDNWVDITVQTAIDTSVTNKGILTEGEKRHFRLTEVADLKDTSILCIQTLESKVSVCYTCCLKVQTDAKEFYTTEKMFNLKLERGQTACFTKMFSIYTSRDLRQRNPKNQAIRTLRKAVKVGFQKLLDEHIESWDQMWNTADISITPKSDLQRALRFNIYHLIICGNRTGSGISIGARTLSGEGYRGHIFWDAEIFVLPFFIYTNPVVARNMLTYRYHRLEAAKENAVRAGFEGAFFPWESADKGLETTPSWHKDLDGKIKRIYTGQLEHHIVADIAYTVWYYHTVTADEDFMLKMGLELFFETARFWANRVEYDKEKDIYNIRHLIGPDEFHVNVDNNAYTNYMARWNLLNASSFFKKYNDSQLGVFKRLSKRIGLSSQEAANWEKIAEGIFIPIDKKRNLIEAFEGYFQKKDIPITELDANFIPKLPRGLSFKEVGGTQLVKQPDVVMILYLLSEEFNPGQKKENFLYYDKRTLHTSSLSPSISAIMALEAGNFFKAYHYFTHSLYADLKNLHGNTAEGIHAASLGGTWQAVLNGFCGMGIKNDMLCLDPKLPPEIRNVKFRIKYRRFELSIWVRRKALEIWVLSIDKKDVLTITVYDKIYNLSTGRGYVFKEPLKAKTPKSARLPVGQA